MVKKILSIATFCGLLALCYADGAKCVVDAPYLNNKEQNTCCMLATAGVSPLDIPGKDHKRKTECKYAECTQFFWGRFDNDSTEWILTRIKINPTMAKAIDEEKYYYFIVDYCNGKIIKACSSKKYDDCLFFKSPE